MAVEQIKNLSSVSFDYKPVETPKPEIKESSARGVPPSDNVSAVSVSISNASSVALSKPDFVTNQEERLQRTQSRFERISSDEDGRASQDELIAIKRELNEKGRQTPGLDRAIANFSRLNESVA